MSTELDKTFDPAGIESKWYAHWENRGLFRPERPDAEPFTLVNPPPNVTGSLHIGHALDNTLQDVVIRYERMRGKDAMWVVGMDHAGIATQMVVERQMELAQDKRTNYTREQFVEKVWEWKAESGGQITKQLRRLGCSMDWSREQFTMDPHFTRAVTKVFVDLYNGGLIYRDKRLVNWDPKLKTAISDLEVETREIKGSFWHFKYPLADGVTLDSGQDYIEVATTRPETMLADMAVAVHPTDERYKSVIGRHVILPITGRRVPVVADEHADPELGSGAVKITPGHDFNDFEVGKRAGFAPGEMLNMLDADAAVCQVADSISPIPEKYLGKDRFEAREMVVSDLKELGCLIPYVAKDKDGNETEHDAEPRTIQTPYGDRGGVVIEPWLTDQWYVDAETLARAPMEAVRSGAIEIVPKSWEKTFFNWMENIQPWCVSRQLWWGHRIPAWYGPDGEVFVAETDEEVTRLAVAHYQLKGLQDPQIDLQNVSYARIGNEVVGWVGEARDTEHHRVTASTVTLTRDEDVLDTWFSSALWPFATLGWPDETYQPVRPEPVEGPSFLSAAEQQDKSGASTSSARTAVKSGKWGENPNLLSRHYPNDLLISGFDILFFWDARMMMMGMHLLPEVPWRRLYLHGLVRAPDGQKMSKSKGNVVDPLGLIDKYGADALRFFMCAMESQGRDIKMDESRVEGYRNFATKLWNAARFCQANGIKGSKAFAAPPASAAVNRWIVGEVVECQAAIDKAMAELRFDAAANAIYHFVWDRFCDWYLELIKPVLAEKPSPLQGRGLGEGNVDGPMDGPLPPTPSPGSEADPEGQREGELADETRAIAGWALDQILVMLHPFMPFVTEELWSKLAHRPNYPLITELWPEPEAEVDPEAKAEIEWLIAFTSAVRGARNELGVPPGQKLQAFCEMPSELAGKAVKANLGALQRLARLSAIEVAPAPPGAAMQVSAGEDVFVLPLAGVIDIEAEKARLTKALEASRKEAKSLEGRLGNPAFLEKAKPEAVEKARADHAHHAGEADRLEAALARLG